MNRNTFAALAGFLILGLSPSFIDWQQADAAQRVQIAAYYGVALGLIYFGALRK